MASDDTKTANRDPIRGTVTAGDWHIVSYDVRGRDWSRDVIAARATIFGNWWAYSLDSRKQRSGKAVPRDGEEPQAAAMCEADNALREMCELPELTAARAALTAMHRRAQRAEAIADRCVPGRPVSGPGLGRALAAPAHSEAERSEAARPRARLDALTGPGRATLSHMASPTDPPPSRTPTAMLRDLETAAQELMRQHPATPHVPSMLALLAAARAEVDRDAGEAHPRT